MTHLPKVQSSIFGTISPHPETIFRAGSTNLWSAAPQNYSCLVAKPLDVLVYGKPESDPNLVYLAETAHRNLLALPPDVIAEIAERLWRLCREFDELTGLTADAEVSRGLPNLPPWVLETINLADRLATIESAVDIWGFVRPESVLFGYIPDSNDVCVRIACRCDWDEEHGVQIVLRTGREILSVGPQDCFPL
jgi:hypothetical protein